MKKLSLLLIGFLISALSFTQTNHSGTISVNEAWFKADNPHIITGNITIADGVTLLIQPGVEIYVQGNRRVNVYGVLSANATAAEPILFTSNAATPAAGDWRFIYFDGADAGCVLNYVNISYGGSTNGTILVRNSTNNVFISNCSISNSNGFGIRLSNAAANPTISNCSFTDNANYPIYTYADRVKDITGTNTFSGNSPDAVYVRNQTITTGTWLDQGVPYVVNGNCTVADLQTLTIEAGTEIKFNGNNILTVAGALIANGTSSERILFSSNQAVPAKGDWNRIYFNDAEASSLSYCDFEYAGSLNSTIDVRNSGSNVTIDNCSIDNSAAYGIYNRGGSVTTVSNSTIQNCDDYPIYALADGVKNLLGPFVFGGNTPEAIWVNTDVINGGQWLNHNVPYILGGGNFTVADLTTLTIDPGVTMKFDGDRTFTVLGTLVAAGDVANPITFTSNATTPDKGDWRYIYFNDADPGCVLDYCNIAFGGSATSAVYINNTGNTVAISNSSVSNSATIGIYQRINSEATISDCSVTDCDDFPIQTGANKVKDITGTMTITGNTPNAIRVDTENIFAGTWLNHNVPYVIWADVNQIDAYTLTLNPGVELQFNADARLRIYGKLLAIGDAANHIVFTAYSDTPTPGFWERILFDGADPGTMLDYCEIMYGGGINGNVDVLACGNNVSFSNTIITNSSTYGVFIRNGSNPSFINCEIVNNTGIGVFINAASEATFGTSESEWNDIYGNGTYELRNGSLDIDAMYVYWGTDACGDISGLIFDDEDQSNLGVVNYTPYLDAGHGMPNLATTWTGAVNTSWHENGNWDNNAPCDNSDATIPGGVVNTPTVFSDESCNDLTLESGSNLTVGTANSLTVFGDLMLEADATGTASLVENYGVTVAGSTTSEFYIAEDRWHFLSPPMNGQTANVFYGLYLYGHEELTNTFVNIVDETTPLGVGKGYEVWSYSTSTGNVTAQFTGGTLNSGTYFLPVTNTGSGYNFVGNPYPSAVDWDDLSWIKSYIDATVYVWDGVQYITWNGSTGDLTDGIIPAMQGFFVKANGPTPALAVSNESRTHGVDPYKAGSVAELLELTITGNDLYDRIFVNFNEDATAGFDSQFDAYKLMGIEEAPQMYTLVGDEKVRVNTLPQITSELIIPVALEVGAETEYTILASELSSFGDDVEIYLEDLQESAMINLTLQNEYTFNAAPGAETHRFNIHFLKSTTAVDEYASDDITIYSNANSVYVKNTGAELENASMQVYNISGQRVFEGDLQNIPLNKVDLNLETGYYVVKVISNNAINSEKVFIK